MFGQEKHKQTRGSLLGVYADRLSLRGKDAEKKADVHFYISLRVNKAVLSAFAILPKCIHSTSSEIYNNVVRKEEYKRKRQVKIE